MEEDKKEPRPKGRIVLFILWLLKIGIISLPVVLFEHYAQSNNLESWEAFSAHVAKIDSSILGFFGQVSPLGLFRAYNNNTAEYRYGQHLYSLSSPFNLTKACIVAQKKVFRPFSTEHDNTNYLHVVIPPLNPGDDLSDDDTALYFKMNKSGNFVYKVDNALFDKEPVFLQLACSFNLQQPNVVNNYYYPRSFWEKLWAIPDAALTWVALDWHYSDGRANWPGRLFLLVSVYLALIISVSKSDRRPEMGTGSAISLFLGWFLLATLIFGLLMLIPYILIWIFLTVGKTVHAVAALVSTITALWGFPRVFLQEAAAHLGFEGKSKAADTVTGFTWRKFIARKK